MLHLRPHFASYRHQRGMITALVMMLLVATVVVALTLMINANSGNQMDTQRHGDGDRTFFVAESGVEAGQARLTDALGGNITETTCTSVAETLSLAGGTAAVTATSFPSTCQSGSSTSPCVSCTITSQATLGSALRTVRQVVGFTTVNGTFCVEGNNCSNIGAAAPYWKLRLKNASNQSAMAFFALANPQQANINPACDPGSNCQLAYFVAFGNNGTNSVSLMANAVVVPALTTYDIFQTIRKNNGTAAETDVSEVGAFFRGTTSPAVPPTFAGPLVSGATTAPTASYWSSSNTTGSGSSGTTTDGGASSSSWCFGGDTLVFAYAGKVAGPSAAISDGGLLFNTAGTPAQNVALSRVAKFPTPSIANVPATFGVTSSIWAARNPNLLPATQPDAANASSYPARGIGSVGAAWVSGNGANVTKIAPIGATTKGLLTVGSFQNHPAQIISIGDVVVSAGVTAGTTVESQLTGTTGGAGTYQVSISQNVAGAINQAWTTTSTVLNLLSCGFCNFAAGDVLTVGTGPGMAAGRSLTQQLTGTSRGVGTYRISGAGLQAGPSGHVFVGVAGTTLYLPSSGSQPLFDGTSRISVKTAAATGRLAPNTRVSADLGTSFGVRAYTMTASPTTPLDGATICAGTCAFFNHTGSPAMTTYTLALTGATTDGWATGFTCLKGVAVDPVAVTSSSKSNSSWTEVVY